MADSYGPWQALAQIFGAVMERNKNRYISEQVDKINNVDQEQDKVVQTPQGLNKPAQQASDSMLPTGVQQTMGITPGAQSGLLGAAQNIATGNTPSSAQSLQRFRDDPTGEKYGYAVVPGSQPLTQTANPAVKYDVGAGIQGVPTAANVGQGIGIMSAAQKNIMDARAQKVMDMAGAAQPVQQSQPVLNNANTPVPMDKQPLAYQQAQQYKQDYAQHPEWFEGNTYVGSDPAAHDAFKQNQQAFDADRKANPDQYIGDSWVGANDGSDDYNQRVAAAKQRQQTMQTSKANGDWQAMENNPNNAAMNSKSNGFSNPLQKDYGITVEKGKPVSYETLKADTDALKAKVANEILRRYGPEAVKQYADMINNAGNERLNKLADGQDMQNRAALYGVLANTPMTSVQGRNRALLAMENYNLAAKKLGKPALDMQYLGKIVDSGKMAFKEVKLGNRVELHAYNPDGLALGVDQNGKPIYDMNVDTMNMGIDPAKLEEIKEDRYKTDANNRTKLQTTQMTNQSRENVANINGQYGMKKAQISAAARSSSGSASNHRYNKWVNTLSVGKEAALAAIKSGAAKDDPDDHSVEEFRKNCIKALESDDGLDDQDKEQVQKDMEDVMQLYTDSIS